MDSSSFGSLLRAERQRALFTLDSLAEASGVSSRAISDMERGRSLPRPGTLSDLLDVLEPDETRRRLLVRAASRRAQRIPQQLPPDLVTFRGRADVLAAPEPTGLESEGAGHAAVRVISGMAGVGKTALAVHWAHQTVARFPDGQLYVNLRGFEDSGGPLPPEGALGGFLRALGVPSEEIPATVQERSALFRERTASRRLVVVLDNARTAEQVRPLLPASGGSLVLVTSRNQLAGLAATDGALLVSLDVWSRAEALAALTARIGEERCRAEPDAAAELVTLCGYLPLAVAVIGAQLSAAPRVPLRVAVTELREAQPLDALSSTDRRIDVRAVFSHSYRALTAETASFFRSLAVHPGPAISAEAAASLAARDLPTARRFLRELASASLLTRDADGRYVLHDLVRAYGGELIDADERLAAESRLLDYLHHNAHHANRFVTFFRSGLPDDPAPGVVHVGIEDREAGLRWFRQEEPAATAALRTVNDPRLRRRLVHLAQEWVAYNALAGRWSEEITASRIGLDAALALDDPVAVVRSSRYLVRALSETGRMAETDGLVDLMLERMDRLPVEHRSATERGIALLREFQGRYKDALRHGQRGLDAALSIGQQHEIALGLLNVGWLNALLGNHQRAVDLCEQSIPMLRELKNHRGEAVAWGGLGYARMHLGELDAAVADYHRALRICQTFHLDYQQAETLDHLAAAYLQRGDTEQARRSWIRAADIFDTLRVVARAASPRAKAESLRHHRSHDVH
ncbi:ATP-binding protein [Streptomyces tendae]